MLFSTESAGNNVADKIPNFTIRDGLSNNTITVIYQDSFGFLWIGTDDGLNRYDGYEFIKFRYDPADDNSISANHISAIVEDFNNNLWVGTSNGLNKLDYSTGKFTRFLANPDSLHFLPENNVLGLLVDIQGRLWIKTESFLSLFIDETSGFENFGHFNNVFNMAEVLRYPIVQESDSSLLVGSKDGLNRFNIISRQFTRFTNAVGGGFACKSIIYDILPLTFQRFLVASSSGLKVLDFENSVISDPSYAFSSLEAPDFKKIIRINEETILAGTNKGLIAFNPETGQEIEIIPHHESKKIGQITALFQDRSGIIWVGSRFNGLFKINLSPPKFRVFPYSNANITEPLNSKNFQSVFEDSDQSLWLATLEDGIYRFFPDKNRVKHYIIPGKKESNNSSLNVYVLNKDRTGRLWAGTNGGLYFYDEFVDGFVEFNPGLEKGVYNLLKNNHIYALQNDLNGNLWVGTCFGLYRIEGRNVFSFFSDKKDTTGLLSDYIHSLCLDETGNLWIGTSEGLNYWDHRSKQILRVPFFGFQGKILKTPVLSLSYSYKGTVLAGTTSGLWEISFPDISTRLVPGCSNLENDVIKAVVSDHTNRIWVSTNKGIACLNPDGTIYSFDIRDGLPDYVFNKNSVFRNREGTMFFGSTNGLCWFHPDSINYNLVRPSLALTNISITEKGKEQMNLWPNRDNLIIKYKPFLKVDVEFSALEFTEPSKNRYKTFLEGYDTDWGPVTFDNRVSFSNLLPGSYTLKIIASNNDFTWNNDPLELKIIVKPPLWMSNYAFAFYFLVLIFIIHLFINYRIRHYRKVNRDLLEKTVNKKQLETQREILSRINLRLTDSINYARRIQRAMLPAEEAFSAVFPHSFVYLRAKDIVSGDFFWFYEKGDKVFVAAVDCTGHGVPGAFMSIIGMDLLKNVVEFQGIEDPARILDTMNKELIRTLHHDQNLPGFESNVKDGMDMAMLSIDRHKKKLTFAGAYNGFYLIRDNEIHSYKGDRFPIGYLKDGEMPVFTEREILLQGQDIIYLFSDGVPDQFGGPNHKKFKYRRFRLLLLNIHHLPFQQQKSILHQKIEDWMNGENEQVDDMLVIGFKPLGNRLEL